MEIIDLNNINFLDMVNKSYLILDNITNINNNIVLPKLQTEITPTKLYWKNIIEYITILNRNDEHFYLYIKNELRDKDINWYTNNKNDGIIIYGKNLKKINLLDLIKKYINLYVICSSCKKADTIMNKITSKIYEFKCLSCEMIKNIT
jgi:translation initiation factor 2 beta subunit (eIF-2beta)/eIF-5